MQEGPRERAFRKEIKSIRCRAGIKVRSARAGYPPEGCSRDFRPEFSEILPSKKFPDQFNCLAVSGSRATFSLPFRVRRLMT